MTQPIKPLTDEEIKNLSHGFSMTRWAMEAQSSIPVEESILERAVVTIRELKKENERLNNIIRALMNPRMKHGTLQGPLTEE